MRTFVFAVLIAGLAAPSIAEAAAGCPPPGPTPQPPCKTLPGALNYPTCSAAPSYDAPFPVRIGATEFDPKPENPPGSASDGTKYALNTKSSWRLLMNPNIQSVRPYYGYFVTEWGFDHLDVDHATGVASYHGTLNSSTTPVMASDTWTPNNHFGGARDVDVSWLSDGSIASHLPPSISQVAVQCVPHPIVTPQVITTLVLNERVDGLLMKSKDVIHLSALQPANTPMLIVLEAKATTVNADFDLYATTESGFAGGDNHQWRGFGSTANEALDIPVSSSSRWVKIAIHSYSGAGHFSIHALAQHPSERFAHLTVCPVGVTLTTAQKDSLTDFLRSGSVRLLAMTNGNVWAQSFSVTAKKTDCEDSCSVCLMSSGSTSFGSGAVSPQGFGRIKMGLNNWSAGASMGWLFAHESGHSHLSLPDEYSGPPAGNSTPMACGHTIMANHSYARFLCSKAHCKDGHVTDDTVCSASDPNGFDLYDTAGHRHFGKDFSAVGETTDPTDYFDNQSLLSRVKVDF